MKNIVLLIIILPMVISCSNKLYFDRDQIYEVKIVNLERNEERIISNSELIETLFDEYINKNERYLAKFKANYHIIFTYNDAEQLIITNENNIKTQGLTYKIEKDIDTLISNIWKSNIDPAN